MSPTMLHDSGRRAMILDYIRMATPSDPAKQTSISHIHESDVRATMDVIWQLLEHPSEVTAVINAGLDRHITAAVLRKMYLKISIQHNILPTHFYLEKVKCTSSEPMDSGAFADIYSGEYGGVAVVLKRPRITNEDDKKKVIQDFCRESLLWRGLDHKHVLPFLGVSNGAFERSICMVLPYMESGNIRKRTHTTKPGKALSRDNFEAHVDRWLLEVARGLIYLHEQGIVHGDLHGGNILIDAGDHVRLTDFGFALIAAATPTFYGSKHGGAAHHFKAPELWDPEMFGLTLDRPTAASDVYAFACTCIELYTGKVPFAEPKVTMYRLSKKVVGGERPPRPATPHGRLMSEAMWNVVKGSWAQQPSERLSAQCIAQDMEPFVVQSAADVEMGE